MTVINFESEETMQTAHQAIQDFYVAESLPDDGGIDDYLVWVRAFGVPLPVPNFAARAVLVPYHDLHHVITGYATDEAGEGEVAAWCLGSGGGPLLGQLYDLGAFAVGLVRYPKRTVVAFYRGRQGRNLYRRPADDWMSWEVDDLRREARTDGPLGFTTAMDRIGLVRTILEASAIWVALPLVVPAAILLIWAA